MWKCTFLRKMYNVKVFFTQSSMMTLSSCPSWQKTDKGLIFQHWAHFPSSQVLRQPLETQCLKKTHIKTSLFPYIYLVTNRKSWLFISLSIYLFIIFSNIYFWEREKAPEWGRSRERGRQKIQSELCADAESPISMNHEIMT